MFKKLSIRMRLSLMTTLLLTLCCVILTFMLNFSAMKMANSIEMQPLVPFNQADELKQPQSIDSTDTFPAIPASQAKKGFRIESVMFMFLVVLGGGLLTYYLAGKALKPVKILSTQMKNISVHNLSENIAVPENNDELSELTETFNTMTNKLNCSFEAQKRFSANAAHELRTPLAVLKTKVDVFNKKEVHSAQDYSSFIEVVSSHTLRLSDLVQNLLDMTNMQEIKLNETISIKSLLEEVFYDLQDIADSKNITLDLSGCDVIISGNYSLLYRALYNLIENGIKYNINDGKVTAQIKQVAEAVTISISDTGVGVPQEKQTQIFEPFFRVDKSRSRELGGVGLGLSIVESIIDRHNGSIRVSDGENGGTCFQVTLPNK